MRGVIDNGFELTGPIARGDWETVERHLGVIRETRPELEELYLVLARATAGLAGREPQGQLVTRRFRRADGVPDDRRAPRGARTSTLDLRRARAHDGIATRGSPSLLRARASARRS